MKIMFNPGHTQAYLIDASGNVIARWFWDRPDLSTFDPSQYRYGGTPVTGGGGITYDVYSGPGVGGGYGGVGEGGGATVPATTGAGEGYYYDPDVSALWQTLTDMGLSYAEAEAARQENARQFDENLRYLRERAQQDMAIAREQMQHETGMQRYEWEQQFIMAQREFGYASQLLTQEWTVRERMADKELAQRLREMQSAERIAAAETWARPIDYLAYSRWMAGQPAATTESGLPVGAPGWYTGVPEAATVGAGPVATADIYGQRLAEGGRIQEFGAWGGPTTPVAGTPWIAPHQTGLAEFSRLPIQAQEMAYARWRQRGITPETAQQAMRAAAPVGTAGGAIRYG